MQIGGWECAAGQDNPDLRITCFDVCLTHAAGPKRTADNADSTDAATAAVTAGDDVLAVDRHQRIEDVLIAAAAESPLDAAQRD